MPGASDLPFTTVVIPVRNGAAMVGDAISSVLEGDFPADRREILVVDNRSTDGTADVIRDFPVTYVHEPRPGVSNARNRGIAEGRGEVFAFMDGDCIAGTGWLRELVAPFSDPTIGCVAGELGHAPGESVAERQATRMLGAWQSYAVNSNPPYAITANAAYRRSVFEAIGAFDPRMPRAQDVEFGLRFSERSDLGLAYSAEAIVSHRHRSTQRGFFRQQIGWSYGAGLVAAKYHALDGRPSPPPRLIDVAQSARGVRSVLALRFKRNPDPLYRRSFLEDAWFGLMRQAAWYLGARAGMWRGARVFAGEASARTERGGPAFPEPPPPEPRPITSQPDGSKS